MEAAQAATHNKLALQVESIATTASATASQVTQLVDTVAALSTVTQSSATALDDLAESVRKLTNSSAGRDRPKGFLGNCYTCGEKLYHCKGLQG